jgi:phage tail-like protein
MSQDSGRPTSHFRLTVPGMSAANFRELSGLERTTEVITSWATDANGRAFQQSFPGQTKSGAVTLKRLADKGCELYKWADQVAKEGPAATRKTCTIEMLDYDGKPIAKYQLRDAWPSFYEAASLNASENTAAVETFKLAHDGFERLDG